MTERIYYRPIQPGAYYPTIPRTQPGWYLWMSKSYPKETA